MNLLIDAGNTRIKWGWWEDGCWRDEGAAASSAAGWDFGCTQYRPDAIAVSNVAGEAVAARIRACLPFEPYWLRPQADSNGLRLDYDATRLGPDRYAALLACRHLAPCLVVSVGTAVTVDALIGEGAQCRHLGGLILPGRRTAITPGLAQVADGRFCNDWPRNTADALETGRVLALKGAIETMCTRLGAAVPIILGGGDADWLRPYLSGTVTVIDRLVLEGLKEWLNGHEIRQ